MLPFIKKIKINSNDVIKVEEVIRKITDEIEAKEGRLRYLISVQLT